jgi:hypothetical protein
MASDLPDHVRAVRSQLKAAQNVLRTTLQMVAELDDRLAETHSPDGGTGNNGRSSSVEATRV